MMGSLIPVQCVLSRHVMFQDISVAGRKHAGRDVTILDLAAMSSNKSTLRTQRLLYMSHESRVKPRAPTGTATASPEWALKGQKC